MGKLKRSSAVKKNQKASSKSAKQSKLSIEELLSHAEDFMDQFELEKAYQYVKRALDIDSKNLQALEMMAAVQMEMGNVDSAKNIYQKLIELSPNEGYSKYMCLAQLSTGQEAVDYYKKGIELIVAEYEKQEADSVNDHLQPKSSKSDEHDDDEEDSGKITKSDISTAYCSLAELYLTDLCMEENAEETCKLYLDKSIEYDAKNPETLQLMASYWLSKNNNEQAKKYILESVDLWLPKYVEASENGPLVDPTQAITLTYDSRINTTRILTEVEEYDKAITVLEQLIDEDDEVVVIWYMIGWVNYCKGEDYYSNAKFYLKKADELAKKLKYNQRYLDEALKSHIKELLDNLANVPSEDEAEDDKENDVADDDDDQYETDSEEENESEQKKPSQNGQQSTKTSTLKLNSQSTDKNNNIEEPMEFA